MASNNYEKYEILEIERSDVNFAGYNPRVMSDKARRLLTKNIKEVGLVEPIVYNKRTQRIVSGHQRVKALDGLHKGHDYKLRVAAVDMDEAQEKAQNVFMNNEEAQGDFDLDSLKTLIEGGLDVTAAGFDGAIMHQMFGDDPASAPPEALKVLADGVREAAAILERTRPLNDRDNPDFYLVVVFPSYEARKKYTDSRGLPDNRYVSPEDLGLVQPAIPPPLLEGEP